MKKIKTMLAMAMTALCAMTFSACDEDDEIAYTLEGTWEGNMYVSMMYDGMVYDATYTELCFSRDPYRYSSGSGYWID
ncbi:MAG: hepatitis A virus cellular receptor 1, partial [Alloprevotella sp.]